MKYYTRKPQNIPITLGCLHPIKIDGKTFGCGRCPACLAKKAAANVNAIKLAASSYTYQQFCYLSYSDQFIPKLRIVPNLIDYSNGETLCSTYKNLKNEYTAIPLKVRRISYQNQYTRKFTEKYVNESFTFHMSPSEKDFLAERSKGTIGDFVIYSLSKSDIVDFTKRFRQNVVRLFGKGNTPDYKIFLVGEYGPTRLRPHYHFILFTDSAQLSLAVYDLICKSWWYGVVNSEPSRGFCASYVSQYVNSTACLPVVLADKQSRQFNKHSQHLGTQAQESALQKFGYPTFRDIAVTNSPYATDNQPLALTNDYKDTLFPRTPRYAELSTHQLHEAYKFLGYVRNFYKSTSEDSILILAKDILFRYICNQLHHSSVIYRILHDYLSIDNNYVYDQSTRPNTLSIFVESPSYSISLSRVYRALLVSKKCETLSKRFKLPLDSIIDHIIQYYNDYDYDKLRNFYIDLENLSDYYLTPIIQDSCYSQKEKEDIFKSFYSLYFDNLECFSSLSIEILDKYTTYQNQSFLSAVKNKLLPDAIRNNNKRYRYQYLAYLKKIHNYG